MTDFVFLMHDDAQGEEDDWEPYLAKLKASGAFEGGSAIGDGVCMRKTGKTPALSAHLVGYIRVNADDLDHATAAGGQSAFRRVEQSRSGIATDGLMPGRPRHSPLTLDEKYENKTETKSIWAGRLRGGRSGRRR